MVKKAKEREREQEQFVVERITGTTHILLPFLLLCLF